MGEHLLFAESATLPAEGALGEGGEAGAGAEELGEALALVGRLAFLQWRAAIGAGHFGDGGAGRPLGHLTAQRQAGRAAGAEGDEVLVVRVIHHGIRVLIGDGDCEAGERKQALSALSRPEGQQLLSLLKLKLWGDPQRPKEATRTDRSDSPLLVCPQAEAG